MKFNKLVALILVFVGLLCLGGGIVYSFLATASDKNVEKKVVDKDLNQKEIDAVYHIERNDSKKLSERHCLNSLCIDNMEITYQDEANGNISGTLINTSSEVIPSGYINFIFTDGENTITTYYSYLDINPSDSVPLEILFTDKNYLNVTDYELETPSAEAIAYYQSQVS